MTSTRRWPVRVQCFGRRYEAHTVDELQAITNHLVNGEVARANRYRVGASWPRGQRRSARYALWPCADCQALRGHREYQERCPVSQRDRALAERRP